MKLDNKGFGYIEMLVLTCFILICLLVSTYYVNALESSINNTHQETEKEPLIEEEKPEIIDNQVYEDYLITMATEGQNYAINHNMFDDMDSTIYLPLEELLNANLIAPLEECNGYIKIVKENDNYNADAYMSCKNFQKEEVS